MVCYRLQRLYNLVHTHKHTSPNTCTSTHTHTYTHAQQQLLSHQTDTYATHTTGYMYLMMNHERRGSSIRFDDDSDSLSYVDIERI